MPRWCRHFHQGQAKEDPSGYRALKGFDDIRGLSMADVNRSRLRQARVLQSCRCLRSGAGRSFQPEGQSHLGDVSS